MLSGLFASLTRCPVCRQRPSSPQGCCAECARAMFQPRLEATHLSLGVYGGRLEKAVKALKFHHTTRLARLFAERLAQEVRRARWPIDAVCPVPLHFIRHMNRGYNQTALIAKPLAGALGCGYLPVLRRHKRTRQQARLGASERQENVAGAFSARPLNGERILLLDDVMTSGATTVECSLALLEAGATAVYTAAVAKVGEPAGPWSRNTKDIQTR